MTKTQITFALLLAAALLFSACQPSQPGAGAGGRASAAGITPGSQSTGRLPGALSAGLDSLNSYRAAMTMTFDGSRDGQPLREELVWTEEVVRQPTALRITYSSEADRGDLLEIVSTGGRTYTLLEDECLNTQVEGDPKTLIGFEPSAFFGSLSAQSDLGVETIDGIPVRHYRADTSGLGFASGFTDAHADMWVAEAGGYVVRYVFEGRGSSADLFGRGDTTPGAVRIEYQVSDVNQAITIAAPESCGSLRPDVPHYVSLPALACRHCHAPATATVRNPITTATMPQPILIVQPCNASSAGCRRTKCSGAADAPASPIAIHAVAAARSGSRDPNASAITHKAAARTLTQKDRLNSGDRYASRMKGYIGIGHIDA